MSSSKPQSSRPTNSDKSVQYASTAPSVASLLNLTQVQEKKKPIGGTGGLAVGGIKATPGLVGKPLTLGLKKTPVPLAIETKVPVQTVMPVADSLVAHSKAPLVSTVHHSKVEKKISETKAIKSHPRIELPIDHFDPNHWRLFVGNLGPEVSDSILLSSFQNAYPSTSKALIVRDWKSQKSKGYGFVAFAEGKEFLRALKEMQGKWIGNRQAIIKKSDHQPNK